MGILLEGGVSPWKTLVETVVWYCDFFSFCPSPLKLVKTLVFSEVFIDVVFKKGTSKTPPTHKD